MKLRKSIVRKYYLLTVVRDEKFEFLLIPQNWNFSHPRCYTWNNFSFYARPT